MQMGNEQKEMYLKTLYELEEGGKRGRITVVSRILHVAPPSVSEMLDKLKGDGLVNHKRYGEATLTGRGRNEARKIVRKHRLIITCGIKVFGMKDLEIEACRIEHALSDKSADALDEFLGRPKKTPDGKPIPQLSGKRSTGGYIPRKN